MYRLIDSNNVWGKKKPVSAGYPEDMAPDLCFVNDNFPSNITEINSKVLIESLLNSTELLKQLGYKLVAFDSSAEPTDSIRPAPDGDNETPAVGDDAPPLTDDVVQDDAPDVITTTSDDSLVQQSAVPKREYTHEEKQILTAARKSYQREMNCAYDKAKAYVYEHAEEYIAAHYAELTREDDK